LYARRRLLRFESRAGMNIHLVDGTYELFRHFYGLRRFSKSDPPLGAVRGLLHTVLGMLETGTTHIGVATDHVIESFRNALWPGYKTGAGIEPALFGQFHPLEEALAAMGIVVWPMVDLEADDALASAAHLAALDDRVEAVCIWSPDKDLAQCVVQNRVVQVDRRSGQVRDAAAIRAKFGVDPEHIPDYLALVGDASDGYPGLPGIGAKRAAALVNRYGRLEDFPGDVLGGRVDQALLFKQLATLRIDAALFSDVMELSWRRATGAFEAWAGRVGDPSLLTRVRKLEAALDPKP
jgi:5'-3' exonuclease